MRTISSFLGTSASKRVEALHNKEGLSKEERRQAEQRLLKPEVIPNFTGDTKTSSSLVSVKLYFKKAEVGKLFKKYFKVTSYVEDSCYRLDMLEDLFAALEEGSLSYDSETRKFKHSGNRERSTPVGKSQPKHVRRSR